MSNGNLIYVVGGLAALAVFLFFLIFRAVWEASTQRIRARLQSVEEEDAVVLRRRQPIGWMARLDQAFENLVLRTGLDLRPDQAVGWILLIGAAIGIAAYFIHEEIWFAVLGFTVGAGGVLITFLIYRNFYLAKLEDQLADTIYLLARSLRTGMSLEQALEMIGERGIQPLAAEFKRCHAQIKLGLPVTIALENMARDLHMIDFNALVSTVAVFQTTGGNLPMLLDRLAAQARDRSNLRKHFRTATALARVSIIPIGLAVPAIILAYYIWQPDYATAFLETTNGRIIVACGILAECIGLFWIYRLLRFDY